MKILPAILSLSLLVSATFFMATGCQSEDGATAESPVVKGAAQIEQKASGTWNETEITQAQKDVIVNQIKSIDPSLGNNFEIEKTPVNGLVWVMLPSGDTFIFTEDGKYLVGTQLRTFVDGKIALVEGELQKKAVLRAKEFAANVFVDEPRANLVTFPAKGEKKGEVYVFTDVNCGYCRKFHNDVPALNKAGIEVNYFAGPFYSKKREPLEQIWCAADQQTAMTKMKQKQKLSGIKITEACKNIVSRHIEIGTKLGVNGTPAVYTRSGQKLGGYIPPAALIKVFAEKQGS